MVAHLKDLINFRKFKKGTKAEVDELLKHEKEEYPNRIPYGLGISYEHPGVFILSYIRSTNPHHEYIAIHPKGFKFRKQIFNNVEQLMAYFQTHINDNVTKDQSKGKARPLFIYLFELTFSILTLFLTIKLYVLQIFNLGN